MPSDRTGFIGSSEIATVLGLNPFQTLLELWAIKTGQIESKDLSDVEAVEWGVRLEKVVAKKFADKHKVKLIAYKKRFVHPKYDFLTCELDTIISGTNEMVEIKTCNAWKFKDWEQPDDIPAHYICQVMFALGLSSRNVGHIAVLIGGQKYIEKKVIFDEQIYNEMVRKAVVFWQTYVLTKTMPMLISNNDDNILYQLFPNAQIDKEINLPDEVNIKLENLEALNQDKKSVEGQIGKIKNELKSYIKENEVGTTGLWRIKWSNVHKDAYEVKEQNYRQLSYKKIENKNA